MTPDKMGAEDGTVIDADAPLEPGNGKGFISRRVASDPLRLPYSRIVHEVTKEIILATYEQRPDLPKTATAPERYNERNGRAATPNPAAVRGRIQGLLIDGLLTAFISRKSGRIFRVSLNAFAHESEPVFDAMEQGRKITVPAMPENIIVDFDSTTDTQKPSRDADDSGMVTGTVFFREDNFREACTADPVEIDYGEPTPQATTPQTTTPEADASQAVNAAAEKSKPGNKFTNANIFDFIDPILNGNHGGTPINYPDYCKKLLKAHGSKMTERNLRNKLYEQVWLRYDEWARAGGYRRRQQRVNGRLVDVE